MAGLCMKSHFGLAPLPVSKQRGVHGFSSSSWCSMPIIAAKAGPKLETRKDEQTPNPFTFTADINGKQVQISIPQHLAAKQIQAPCQPGKRKKQSAEPRKHVGAEEPPVLGQVQTDVQSTTFANAEGDRTKMHVNDVEGADNKEDSAEEGDVKNEDPCEKHDRSSDLGASELDEVMEMFVPPGAVFFPDKPLSKLPGSNIHLGPYAKGSKIKEAVFVKSSKSVAECPPLKLPEFAMVGRSNVGKSSLINFLVQRKDLASTSKKPGKTQLINHFKINNSWYLVDLPGYGYAKVPGSVRATWDTFTKDFFLQSKSLVCVMLLVDASIPPQQNDLEYADWLHTNKVPMTIVFTKCDRKKKQKNGGRKPVENIKDFLGSLKEKFDKSPPWIMTSCVTNQGKTGLLLHMSQLRNYWSS